MKIYRISQKLNTGYDTYDSAVVCAPDEATAREMHPDEYSELLAGKWDSRTWAKRPNQVSVELVGVAVPEQEAGVICASFNAG